MKLEVTRRIVTGKEDMEMKVGIVEFVENEMVELDVLQIGSN